METDQLGTLFDGVRVLSFDCYGTLIDWETGILAALASLRARAERAPSDDDVLEAFAAHEARLERDHPKERYPAILERVAQGLAHDWMVATVPDEVREFGRSVAQWPAFPDSPDALAYLHQHFALVVLSNVDRASFASSNLRLGVQFDQVCTAEDVGSYKPAPQNFQYLLDRVAMMGYARRELLHVAQSLYHDHAPAHAFGIRTAWIDRRAHRPGFGATPQPPSQAQYDARFTALEQFASAHRQYIETLTAADSTRGQS